MIRRQRGLAKGKSPLPELSRLGEIPLSVRDGPQAVQSGGDIGAGRPQLLFTNRESAPQESFGLWIIAQTQVKVAKVVESGRDIQVVGSQRFLANSPLWNKSVPIQAGSDIGVVLAGPLAANGQRVFEQRLRLIVNAHAIMRACTRGCPSNSERTVCAPRSRISRAVIAPPVVRAGSATRKRSSRKADTWVEVFSAAKALSRSRRTRWA